MAAGGLHAQQAAAPPTAAAAAQVAVLQPRTVAQLLVTRSLELAYARDSASIASALFRAEAALYEPVVFGAIRRTLTDRQRTSQEILDDALKNKGLFLKLEEQGNTLEVGVRQKSPTGGDVSATVRTRTLEGNDPARYPAEIRASSALVLAFRQPLMRGRGIQYTETDKRVAELEAQVAAW
jgi:hypothetical protein